MRIRVLGPLELDAGSRPVALGPPKQRLVLALLLARADTVVPVADIVDELWGEEPPKSAESNVRLYVNNLRRLLREHSDAPEVARHGQGFLLTVGPAHFDLRSFRQHVAGGRGCVQSGDFDAAAQRFAAALALWRGPAAADLPGGRSLTGWRMALAEERLWAAEARAEALLNLGLADQVLSEISAVYAEAPWRESIHALLIRARYQSGDVAGALAAYDEARRGLIDGLGIEPGEELTALQKAVLNRDPALRRPCRPAPVAPAAPAAPAGPVAPAAPAAPAAPVAPVAPAGAGGWSVPRQLPADPVGFVGRSTLLGRHDEAMTAASLSVVTGPAGIGKTAFAVRRAHLAKDHFPDGQLYADLRGFGPLGPPAEPAEVLRGFLEAFDVPPARIPAGLDSRAALFRTLLADRRVLVVLDNARDTDQVRALLPGAPGSVTLVTSRDRLAGLIATEGARPLALHPLTADEAHDLLAVRLGKERLTAEPAAAADIVATCGGLPLALAIVAARAAVRPGFSLATTAADLRDPRTRLRTLSAGDHRTDLREVLSWSYRRLSPDAARLLRLLGRHAGPQFTAPAAAGLAGVRVAAAHTALDELAQLHLIAEPAAGRYVFHDLVRTYAVALDGADGQGEHAAGRRILDHYARRATNAARQLGPRQEVLAVPGPVAGVQAVAYSAQACPDRALAEARRALTRFEAAGNDTGAGRARLLIAELLADTGRTREALRHSWRALTIFSAAGDREGRARALNSLGHRYGRRGVAPSQGRYSTGNE